MTEKEQLIECCSETLGAGGPYSTLCVHTTSGLGVWGLAELAAMAQVRLKWRFIAWLYHNPTNRVICPSMWQRQLTNQELTPVQPLKALHKARRRLQCTLGKLDTE